MLPGYNKDIADQLRKLSKVFEERDPFVLPGSHRGKDPGPKLTGVVLIGDRIVSIKSVKDGRACEDIGLMDLVAHLGVGKSGDILNICEGRVYNVLPWDGVGYPCHIGPIYVSSAKPKAEWIYDFDLWNFRWTDNMPPGRWSSHNHIFSCNQEHYAWLRFGTNVDKITQLLGGCLKFSKYHLIADAVNHVMEEMELEPTRCKEASCGVPSQVGGSPQAMPERQDILHGSY